MERACGTLHRLSRSPRFKRVGVSLVVSVLAFSVFSSTGAFAGGATGTKNWSRPIKLIRASSATSQSQLDSVSCPSSTFCTVATATGAVIFQRDGKWSAPQPVNAGGSLDSISCTSSQYCVAVSDYEAVTFNGSSWSKAKVIGPDASYSVSCPTTSFCATVGASGTIGGPKFLATYNGNAWRKTTIPSAKVMSDRLMDVSCATPTYCVGVNLNGSLTFFDGKKWTTKNSNEPKNLISVSCPIVNSCVAVSMLGKWVAIHNESRSAPKSIPSLDGDVPYSVSCATASTCVVITLTGKAATWRGGHWSKSSQVFKSPAVGSTDVSCSSDGRCMAVNSRGDVSIY